MSATARFVRLCALVGVVLASSLSQSAEAPEKEPTTVSLFLTYQCKPENRPALREYMTTVAAAQFQKWKSEGVFKDYAVLFSSYVHMNSIPWDMLIRLDFERYADTRTGRGSSGRCRADCPRALWRWPRPRACT